MKLGAAIREYIDHKYSLGMTISGDAARLTAFLRQRGDVERNSISLEDVQAYLKGRKTRRADNAFLVCEVSGARPPFQVRDQSALYGTPGTAANSQAQETRQPHPLLVHR